MAKTKAKTKAKKKPVAKKAKKAAAKKQPAKLQLPKLPPSVPKPEPDAPAFGEYRGDEAIKAEIAALKEIRDKVRRFSGFGEDNRRQIDAQVDVLEDRMDEDDVYERYSPPEPDEDDDSEDDSEDHSDLYPRYVLDSALEAVRWMDGEEDEAPSDGWKPLVEKP